jgi:hypothetical protein
MSLVIVTASTNPNRAVGCLASWGPTPKILVLNGPHSTESKAWTSHIGNVTTVETQKYLGTVEAFKAGVDFALEQTDAEIIACLHDDVQIFEPDWTARVERLFNNIPACGLAGFGGAIGVGAIDIYKSPYNPMHLARVGFRSNLQDAEVHGIRSLLMEKVACLDGFSQIGRRAFWSGARPQQLQPNEPHWKRPWHVLSDLGVTHHAYDGMLGCIAARYGWECWYLPVRCKHFGGQTAVGDAGYQEWAKTQVEGGDHGFWEKAHAAWYEHFNDVLPLRV